MADFDILLEAGDVMGRAGIAGVEAWFHEWLFQQPPGDEMVSDMAGAFLMGCWSHAECVDSAVVERLLGGLDSPTLGRNARDSLICALANAYRKLSDRDLADKIAVRFETIWSDGEDFQPVVAMPLRSVLRKEDAVDEC